MLNADAHSLEEVASPKGLVVGLREPSEPETTPLGLAGRSVEHLKWILVVEKEVGPTFVAGASCLVVR